MTPNSRLLERLQIAWGFGPIELTSARTGDVICMKGYKRCGILLIKGIGTAGQDPTVTVLQGTDVAFGTNKALNFTELYVKQDPTSLADVGQWTKVTQAAGNTYTDATSAEQATLWWIEFKAEDLDIANNYDCIRASLGDAGTNTQLGALIYILGDPLYAKAPEDMMSVIVD